METERQAVRSWITEGIILAGIPATTYLWALLYELAYANYFSIPWYSISLSSVQVLIIVRPYIIQLALVYIALVVVVAMRPLVTHFDRFASRSPRNRAISTCVMSCILLAISVFLSYYQSNDYQRIILIIVGILPLASFFIHPLLYQRGMEGNYRDKLIAHHTPHRRIRILDSSSPSTFRDVLEFFAIIITIVVIVSGLYLFPWAGRVDAERQRGFKVIARSSDIDKEVVVLRAYGDYLFAVPFNRSTKEFEKKLFILKTSEMNNTPLTTEEVGPLTPIAPTPAP